MVVGVIDADGRIDRGFGSGGWANLPWPGQPTALLREPSGEIVLGVQDGMDCCELEFLGAISATGTVLRSFGVAGRVSLPIYSTGPEGAHINQIARADNGDLFVVSSGGHMGSLASAVSEFTPKGKSVAAFDRNMTTNIETSRVPSTFVGGVVGRPGGVVFIGAGQAGPIGFAPEPTAAGRLLPFDDDGLPVGSVDGAEPSKFSSIAYWDVWAFPRPNGGYLMIAASPPYEDAIIAPQRVEVVALTRSGAVDRTYADDGYGSFLLPVSSGPFFVGSATSSGDAVAIVWDGGDATTFELTEVNL
jgi:hypothetical protein